MVLTFASTVRPTKYGALLYSAEGMEDLSNIVFGLLFAEHANEQLAI